MLHLTRIATPLLVVVSAVALAACQGEEPSDDLTPPGAELSFGDTASVTRSGDSGLMSLSVDGIDEGDPADLEVLGAEGVDGRTPYYVRVTATPEKGTTPITLDEYLNVFAGDDPLTHLSVFVDFEPCQESEIDPEPIGKAQETCLVFLADDGAPAPDAVYFDNADDYAAADGHAVKWQ